jgi:hypothetical protein
MGTIAASVIIGQVEETLFDTTNKTWPAAFHLANLNKAISNTVAVKPDTFIVSGLITLQAGTDQVLPAGGTQAVEMIRTAAGGVIKRKDRNKKDNSDPDWHAAAQTAAIKHWYPSEFDKKRFLVDPPALAGAQIYGRYCGTPARLTSESDIIPIDDIYETALWAATTAHALLRSTKRGDVVKAQYFASIWAQAVSASAEKQREFFPLPPEETPTAKVAAA